MARMTPEREASYALDYGSERASLSMPAQLIYDRLLQERKERVETSQATSRPQEIVDPQSDWYCTECGAKLTPNGKFCASCGTPINRRPRTDVSFAPDNSSHPDVSGNATRQDMPIPDTTRPEHRNPPPGIVLKTLGGGTGNIILGVALIGGVHNAGAIIFGVLFILLGVATWILGGFGRKRWDEMPPASRAIAGTGAVIGMLFLYVLFFWFWILRWMWKYIIDPGLRS